MIRHSIYEELVRIREVLAMQVVLSGINMKSKKFDPNDVHEVAMADQYQKMMEKCIGYAFPERVMRKFEEEELCDICLRPRHLCREEHDL